MRQARLYNIVRHLMDTSALFILFPEKEENALFFTYNLYTSEMKK